MFCHNKPLFRARSEGLGRLAHSVYVSQVAEHRQSRAVKSDWIADERKALGEFELTIFYNFLSVLCP